MSAISRLFGTIRRLLTHGRCNGAILSSRLLYFNKPRRVRVDFFFYLFFPSTRFAVVTLTRPRQRGRRASGTYLILKKWLDRLSRHLTFPKSLEMYPAKIMKPLFHLFSFHFISPLSLCRIVPSHLSYHLALRQFGISS